MADTHHIEMDRNGWQVCEEVRLLILSCLFLALLSVSVYSMPQRLLFGQQVYTLKRSGWQFRIHTARIIHGTHTHRISRADQLVIASTQPVSKVGDGHMTLHFLNIPLLAV